MKHTWRIACLFLFLFWQGTMPALALSEDEVHAAVETQGREGVTGTLFLWFLCAIAFLKVSTKLDGILHALGLGVGRAPGSLLAETMMALRGISMTKTLQGGAVHSKGAQTMSAGLSGGLAGVVSRATEQSTAAQLSGTASGGPLTGLGARMYQNTLGQDGGFASRVIGSVATGETAGFISGEAAQQALEGYFSADSSVPAGAGTDLGGGWLGGEEQVEELPIPSVPLAMEGENAIPVSPGFQAEIASAASPGGDSFADTIPTSPGIQQAAMQRVLNGQMGNAAIDVEIGGGKITGREIIPGQGQIQFAMYNARQFEKPGGHFTEQTSLDGEKWYKVYATSAVERIPAEKDEKGHYQYEERKVAVMPKAPQRRK